MSLEAESSGSNIRDTVEAAVATHAPSPDIDSIVSGAIEQRNQEARERNRKVDRFEGEARSSDSLRNKLRSSLYDEKEKVAAPKALPGRPIEVAPGAPKSWHKDAQAVWTSLPQEARLAIQRDHASFQTAAENNPQMAAYRDIDSVMAPVREKYQRHGLKSDAEAIGRLMQWEAAMSDPRTAKQTALQLMHQVGLNVHELAAMAGGAAAPQSYGHQPQVNPQAFEVANRQVGQFAQGKPHFEAVRETMGALIQARASRYVTADGKVNLDRAYADACRVDGLDNANRARAAVSPSSRAPVSANQNARKSGSSVRDSLVNAFKESRRA